MLIISVGVNSYLLCETFVMMKNRLENRCYDLRIELKIHTIESILCELSIVMKDIINAT